MSVEKPEPTVVVTGGSGYLAGWVITELLERGFHVRATVRDLSTTERLRTAIAARSGEEAAASIELLRADLLHDAGWEAALTGADFLLHTASPMPFDLAADLITTAREGTRRVLEAAARTGVQRVVLTSSGVTAVPEDPEAVSTESTRSKPADGARHVYSDSKILAEQDAWQIASATGLALTTVLPTFMQGPPVGDAARSGTIDIVRRLITGKLPALPRIGWNVVDVRDVARLHLLAMTNPSAVGERFLGSGTFLWYTDIARIIRDGMPDIARTIPARRMPDIALKALARINPQIAMIRPELGVRRLVDNSKARDVLGWQPREVGQTILDTAVAIRAAETLGATGVLH